MYLNAIEEKMLDGEYGEITARMMRLLVRLGEIYGAEDMIPVSMVQVAGVSYKSIGDPGTEFLEDIANKGARVSVPSFLNPAGMDLEKWKELGFPEDFAEKQCRIIDSFKKMGVTISATCTPYLAGALPHFREHIAWSESSAVSFANSVIGARTNREGGPSALASAICGRTPRYGLHLDENRAPTVLVNVSTSLRDMADFGALGYYLGKIIKNQIPYFVGIKGARTEDLKALGAAMAATGAVALYHIEGITPEAEKFSNTEFEDRINVGDEEIREVYDKFGADNADAVFIGCPHASINEIAEIAEMLKGKKVKKTLWVFTSRCVKALAEYAGYAGIIESAGGKLVCDTCMVVSPIERMGFSTTAVNSGKAAHYLPGFCKQKVIFGKIKDIIGRVVE